MNARHGKVAETRPLDILGISEAEERIYCELLKHPGATIPEIAKALGLSTGKTQRLVNAIAVKGLTTYTPEQPRRYVPASPDIALGALASHHHTELRRAEDAIKQMQEVAGARQKGGRERMVELVISHAAARNVLERILRASQNEVLVLTRPPVLISQLDVPYEREQGYQIEAQARGVRFRSIVDHNFLALPGAVTKVRHDVEFGEEVRVLPAVPSKILISDRRIALIPLNPQGGERSALLIRPSDLLDTLCALFDILWERAVPISFAKNGIKPTGDPDSRLSEETRNLIQLMAAGLNDKKIVGELGISTRTLERRVAELMDSMGTRTRFQTGWLLALHLFGMLSGGVTNEGSLDADGAQKLSSADGQTKISSTALRQR